MTLPRVVVFGEALTDLVQHSPGQWQGHPGGAPWNVARTLARLGDIPRCTAWMALKCCPDAGASGRTRCVCGINQPGFSRR